MKISVIDIIEFGGLKNRIINLDDKMNLLYGGNESGKSTVLLFIKFMLYGISTRSRTAGVSDRDRMLSWDGSAASGKMDITHNGKRYRIWRSVNYSKGKKAVSNLSVTDLDTIQTIDIGTSPGEFFLGIDAETFESTCSVGQFRTAEIDGEKTGSAIDNILSSADENIDTAKILEFYRTRIKTTYTRPNRQDGIIDRCEQAISKLEAELTEAFENHKTLKTRLAEFEENKIKTEQAKERLDKADAFLSDVDKVRTICEFERLRETKEQREKLEEERRKLIKENCNADFIPDYDDLQNLRIAIEGVKSAKESLQTNKAELERVIKESKTDPQKIKIAKKIEENGAKLLKAKAEGYKRNKSTFGILAALMLICSLAAAGFGVLDFLAEGALFLPLAGISALTFIFFVFFLVISIKNSARLKRLLSEYGVKFGEFAEFIDENVSYLAAAKSAEDEIKKKETKIDYDRDILTKAEKRLSETLLRFGTTIASGDILCDAEKTEEKCSGFLKRHDEIRRKITELDGIIRQGETLLAGKSEEKLRAQLRNDISEFTDEKMARAEEAKKFCEEQYRACIGRETTLSAQIGALEAKARNPLRIEAELDAVRKILETEREKLAVIQKAFDAIERAGEAMRNNVTPQIRKRAGEIIAHISGGKYSGLGLHKDLQPHVDVGNSAKPAGALSGGTRDAVYLALRLSVLEMLTGKEAAVFLDESLSQLDDTRASRVLDFLRSYSERGGQCLIFTCHNREEKLLTDQGIEFAKINLDSPGIL